MRKFKYIAISLVILCFGGVVFATDLAPSEISPKIDNLISYINQAQLQEQAF